MGKSVNQLLFLCVFPIAFFAGCSVLDYLPAINESWTPGRIETVKGTVSIGSVSIERAGDMNSLEREIRDILPLIFSEESYRVVSPGRSSDYSAAVSIREREYLDGWQTKRSLSVEVRLWDSGAADESSPSSGGDMDILPLSAGRSLKHGQQSIASSKTLCNMLRKAVKNAVGGLPVNSLSGREQQI